MCILDTTPKEGEVKRGKTYRKGDHKLVEMPMCAGIWPNT